MNKNLVKSYQTTNSALDITEYLLSLDPKRQFFNKQDGNERMNYLLHILFILYYVKTEQFLFYEDMMAVSPNFWEDKDQQQFLKKHE